MRCGLRTVAAVLLEVVEERADQRRVEVSEVQLARLLAGLLLGEREQQPERVAVGRDRPRAGVLLGQLQTLPFFSFLLLMPADLALALIVIVFAVPIFRS